MRSYFYSKKALAAFALIVSALLSSCREMPDDIVYLPQTTTVTVTAPPQTQAEWIPLVMTTKPSSTIPDPAQTQINTEPEIVVTPDSEILPGDKITWIGDSYSVDAVELILEKFPGVDLGEPDEGNFYSPYSYIQYGKHADLISNCGRTRDSAGGPSGLDILSGIEHVRPILVFALGTNDIFSADQLTETLESLKNAVPNGTKVVLVTCYTAAVNDYTELNWIKRRFAEENDGFYVADWAAIASPSYFITSEIHPNDNGGSEAWVGVIFDKVKEILLSDE